MTSKKQKKRTLSSDDISNSQFVHKRRAFYNRVNKHSFSGKTNTERVYRFVNGIILR